MPYQLSVFRHILQDELSPAYFPLEAAEQATWYDQLATVPQCCTKQVHARFHYLGDLPPALDSLRVRLLDQPPVPVFMVEEHTVYPCEALSGEDLLSQVLKQLTVTKEAVLEWYHWQDERGALHLELFAQYPLDTLTAEERRYYFYQCLLDEQVEAIQEKMVQHVHQTASPKEVRKYVQDHQRDLLTYANEVFEYLNEAQAPVYGPPDAYLLPDVYRLIFLRLEELTTFLEQQFAQYLDAAAPLPYHHQFVQVSRLAQTIQQIQSRLNASPVSPELVALLEEIYADIQQPPSQETTSKQLAYYHQIIQAVDLAEPTDQSVSAALVSINFNSPAFVAWYITQLQDQLEAHPTTGERLQVLHQQRKLVKQLVVDTSLSYQPERVSVREQVLTWIEEEITYLREVGEVLKSGATEPAHPERSPEKIKTNLSVPQISLLLRMFLDRKVDIFPEQNQNNIYRQISRILQSTRQEDISEKSLRDRYYKADQHTVAVLKEKVIAMLNYLNGLS